MKKRKIVGILVVLIVLAAVAIAVKPDFSGLAEEVKGITPSALRGTIEAPRIERVPAKIEALAWDQGLELTLKVNKGLWNETVMFEVQGTHAETAQFALELDSRLHPDEG